MSPRPGRDRPTRQAAGQLPPDRLDDVIEQRLTSGLDCPLHVAVADPEEFATPAGLCSRTTRRVSVMYRTAPEIAAPETPPPLRGLPRCGWTCRRPGSVGLPPPGQGWASRPEPYSDEPDGERRFASVRRCRGVVTGPSGLGEGVCEDRGEVPLAVCSCLGEHAEDAAAVVPARLPPDLTGRSRRTTSRLTELWSSPSASVRSRSLISRSCSASATCSTRYSERLAPSRRSRRDSACSTRVPGSPAARGSRPPRARLSPSSSAATSASWARAPCSLAVQYGRFNG